MSSPHDLSAAPRRRGRPGGLAGPALLAAAREVFLRDGYAATTMDAVAKAARISKQTLYRQHASKEELFAAVVADWVDRGRDALRAPLDALRETDDPRTALTDLADVLHAGVLSPAVVGMRGLVIAEAGRQPALAADYLRRSWDRNEALLADALEQLSARGLLDIEAPLVAARQFTWLVLGSPLDRITLTAGIARLTPEQLSEIAREAVETFLARFSPPSGAPSGSPGDAA